MLGKLAVHISKEDGDYLEYVKGITSAFGVIPDFLYLEEEGIFNLMSPSEERQRAIKRYIEDFFEGSNFYTLSGKGDKTLRELQESYDLLFVKYKRQLFGKSVPEWILSETDELRLWVYKEGCKGSIKRVCLPVDFSERSIRQVEFAELLKGFFNFDYDLVYAMNINRFINKLSKEDYNKSLLNKKEEVMHMYTDTFGGKDLNLVILEGDPYREMVKHINFSDYNLVIIGRRGKGMRERIGSVSLHMVRSLKCPVVVL
ncbi:MAG: universal stress protein [Aquificaceae bacterium]